MPPAVAIGMVCSECGALVPDSDTEKHDQWHEWLNAWVAQVEKPAPVVVGFDWAESSESDEEMLRRLLREVMELSERMA